MKAPAIICFGEMLWDLLPTGRFPGGAPFNVAYHLHQAGEPALLVSAVGSDPPGDEIIGQWRSWGLGTGGIARDPDRPTGTVRAVFGYRGKVTYQITTRVAWDHIPISRDTRRAAGRARALVFGSLALRTRFNRGQLDRLFSMLPPGALKLFDVNLRAPHDDLALVRELAGQASILKLNTEEAARLTGRERVVSGGEEGSARALARLLGCPSICLTAGAKGAGWLHEGRWHWEPGRKVRAIDPVGAGDAFVATLLACHLAGLAPAESMARACRKGEWVATQPGATPPAPSPRGASTGMNRLTPEQRVQQMAGRRASRRRPGPA